mgnify:CR=1 FL=1
METKPGQPAASDDALETVISAEQAPGDQPLQTGAPVVADEVRDVEGHLAGIGLFARHIVGDDSEALEGGQRARFLVDVAQLKILLRVACPAEDRHAFLQ